VGTKRGLICCKGAPFKGDDTDVWGGQLPKTDPLDPPLVTWTVHDNFKMSVLENAFYW